MGSSGPCNSFSITLTGPDGRAPNLDTAACATEFDAPVSQPVANDGDWHLLCVGQQMDPSTGGNSTAKLFLDGVLHHTAPTNADIVGTVSRLGLSLLGGHGFIGDLQET